MQLAVMDHNENVDRAQAVTLEGYYLVFVITFVAKSKTKNLSTYIVNFFRCMGRHFPPIAIVLKAVHGY